MRGPIGYSRRTNQRPAAASSSARRPKSGGESIGIEDPTVVTAVEVLLPGLGSGVDDVAVAVLTRVPALAVTLTTIVTVSLAPRAMVPRLAVTVPPTPGAGPVHVPTVVVHETKVLPAGRGSSTMTASAASGPAFATRML